MLTHPFDQSDPLRSLRDHFALPPGKIYLDGNSLGVLPRATAPRLAQVISQEWGNDLIESWNRHAWMDMPVKIGDQLAPLIGANPGETLVCDTTSINLYKVVAVALALQAPKGRRVILTDANNFPTDLYMLESLARIYGASVRRVDGAAMAASLTDEVAVLVLTQVDYRTGALFDMNALCAAARAVGALTVWDLAHSCGALPIDLNGAGADFAVGCGYKYLNSGPGSPAFLWSHARWLAADAPPAMQPLTGWLGHAQPFAFSGDYQPAPGILRYLCSSPSVIALAAMECGIASVRAAEPLGGMAAIRSKSLALTDLFIAEVEAQIGPERLRLVTPRAHAQRGSQVSFAAGDEIDGYAVVQALIVQGIVGDFRAPNIVRFGFTPLYVSYAETQHAARALVEVVRTRSWDTPVFRQRNAVT